MRGSYNIKMPKTYTETQIDNERKEARKVIAESNPYATNFSESVLDFSDKDMIVKIEFDVG